MAAVEEILLLRAGAVPDPLRRVVRRNEENLAEYRRVERAVAARETIPSSNEYASLIIHSDGDRRGAGYLRRRPQHGTAPRQPPDFCVKVPCLVDGTGFHPTAATRTLDEVEARCDELTGAHGDLTPDGLRDARGPVSSAGRRVA